MERPQLTATSRQRTSTRGARRLRASGTIPAVVYGKTTEPMTIGLNRAELIKMLLARAGEHGLVTLKVAADGAKRKAWEQPVLIKTLQRHPVNGEILHVDFHAITLTERIRIKIPVELLGVAVGVKQDGGILEHFLREIEIDCLPTEIPKQVDFDISQLKIGDTIHVKDLAAPSGSKITTDPEAVIASVQAPKAEKVEEVGEAVTEPEVIREKKPEEGAEAPAEGSKDSAKKPEVKKAEKKEEK